jgi:general stress protein 26
MTKDAKEQYGAQAHAQFWELIKDIRFAMFTARDAGGHLTSRPMTTQNSASDEDSSLWFFMSRTGSDGRGIRTAQ